MSGEPRFKENDRVTIKSGEARGLFGYIVTSERYFQEVMDDGSFRPKGLRILESHITQTRFIKDESEYDGETYKVHYNGTIGTITYKSKGYAYYVKLDEGRHVEAFENQLLRVKSIT